MNKSLFDGIHRTAEFTLQGGLKMNNSSTQPRQRDVRNACQTIRANWTVAQRRERRLLATAKRRQLIQWLTGGYRAGRLSPN